MNAVLALFGAAGSLHCLILPVFVNLLQVRPGPGFLFRPDFVRTGTAAAFRVPRDEGPADTSSLEPAFSPLPEGPTISVCLYGGITVRGCASNKDPFSDPTRCFPGSLDGASRTKLACGVPTGLFLTIRGGVSARQQARASVRAPIGGTQRANLQRHEVRRRWNVINRSAKTSVNYYSRVVSLVQIV